MCRLVNVASLCVLAGGRSGGSWLHMRLLETGAISLAAFPQPKAWNPPVPLPPAVTLVVYLGTFGCACILPEPNFLDRRKSFDRRSEVKPRSALLKSHQSENVGSLSSFPLSPIDAPGKKKEAQC